MLLQDVWKYVKDIMRNEILLFWIRDNWVKLIRCKLSCGMLNAKKGNLFLYGGSKNG